jgi:hypothetical protein
VFELQQDIPIGLVLPFAIVLLTLMAELGYRTGHWARRRPNHEAERLASDLATPAIGLLGLMLAFTFGWAGTRFDSRLTARLEEARHLGNVFRLADFLPPADRERTRALIREYISISVQAQGVAGFQPALAKREQLHPELWSIAARTGQASPNSQIASDFVRGVSEILNDHLTRTVLAAASRIPASITIGLVAILSLTMFMIGYQMGLQSAVRSRALIPLIMSLAIVFFLIADLNRPLEGWLQLRNRGLIELQRELQNWK